MPSIRQMNVSVAAATRVPNSRRTWQAPLAPSECPLRFRLCSLVLLDLACGSRGHHGRINDVLPHVINGNNPIAIDHAMFTDHISPLSRGKTIGLHAGGKAETV